MRNITVYIPSKYSTDDELGVMVMQDGELGFSTHVNILDNLIDPEDEDRSLPMIALVAIEVAGSVVKETLNTKLYPLNMQSLSQRKFSHLLLHILVSRSNTQI